MESRTLTRGEMRLPAALVQGTSRLKFQRRSEVESGSDSASESGSEESGSGRASVVDSYEGGGVVVDDEDDDEEEPPRRTSSSSSSSSSPSSSSVASASASASASALVLVSHEETIDLVACVNSDRVKNRRVCRDLLEFLDARKPPNTPLQTWDEAVEDAVRYSTVPGMGMFDVDGKPLSFAYEVSTCV